MAEVNTNPVHISLTVAEADELHAVMRFWLTNRGEFNHLTELFDALD